MQLWQKIFTVGGLTLLSRILGFARDAVTAAFLGAGAVADAVFIAFRLPNLFRSLLAEGAFSLAFVPQYNRILKQQSAQHAHLFAEQSLSLLAAVTIGLVILGEWAMPWVMLVIAPGFADGENIAQQSLVIELARITLPYIFFMALVALQGGVLNSLGKFYAFAAAPCILNIVMIAALVLLTPVFGSAAHSFAVGVLLAGLAQYAFLSHHMRRNHVRLRWRRPVLNDELRQMLRAIGPAAIGAGAVQLNILIGVMLGSFLPEGSISYLYYAERLYQLPLGVVGIAIGTVLLPTLSAAISSGRQDIANHQQNRGLELGLLLTLPAAVALAVIAQPIIQVLFMRGAFTTDDVLPTSLALMGFALGLPAYVAIKSLAPAFFARGDTKTPVQIALLSVAVNALLNLLLIGPLQHVGIALGTSLAAWLNVYLLARVLRGRGLWQADAQLQSRAVRIIAASAVMGAFLYVAMEFVFASWLGSGFFWQLLALVAMCGGGFGLYLLLCLALRATRYAEIRQIWQKPATTATDDIGV
jgi:putative peptidoglycan lipid II flippase